MVDAVNKLTINDSKYYESNKSTAIDTQGDLTRNMEIVTHTSNANETVTDTSNGKFEQKILSDRTIPVVVLKMNPRIDQRIAPIVMEPHTILTPAAKKVVANTASGVAWVNRNPQQVIQTGVNGSTPCDIRNDVSVKYAPAPVLIEIIDNSPTCSLSGILKVVKNSIPVPQAGSEKPKNWTLLLTESCPIISILCPFSARQSVTN